MAQKLALPLNNATINAGYKNYAPGYNLNGVKATHYGVDWIGRTYKSDLRFCASGNGIVMGVNRTFKPKSGYTVGKWVIVKYTNVEGYGDLIVRYFHMDRVDVNVGDRVNLDTILGVYGTTGDYSYGNHIHTEIDTDTKYWQYTPTLSGSTNCGLRPGYTGNQDTTINPLSVFMVKTTKPESQQCHVDNDGVWCSGITIPKSFP